MEKLFTALQQVGVTTSINVRKNWYGDMSKAEYYETQKALLELGAEQTKELSKLGYSSDSGYAEFKYNGIQITVWVEMKRTKEEEIADLESKLAKLKEEVEVGEAEGV